MKKRKSKSMSTVRRVRSEVSNGGAGTIETRYGLSVCAIIKSQDRAIHKEVMPESQDSRRPPLRFSLVSKATLKREYPSCGSVLLCRAQ